MVNPPIYTSSRYTTISQHSAIARSQNPNFFNRKLIQMVILF
ncbi:hypothetical protein [Microcoleus sp. B13-B6]